jgi:hypothetical protein
MQPSYGQVRKTPCCSYTKKILGLVIDTNRMTVSVPDNYIQGVCLLIDSTWHTHCQQFS